MKISASFIFFILLLIVNVAVFVKRNDFLFQKQATYEELYPVISSTPVKEITKPNDSTVSFNLSYPSANAVKWIRTVAGKTDSFSAVHPYVNALSGVYEYSVYSPAYRDTLVASIEYIPAGKNRPAFLALYQTNFGSVLPETIAKQLSIDDYEETTADQQKQIDQIIKDSMMIIPSMTTEKKVYQIGTFLREKIYDSRGTPDAQTMQLGPFDSYRAAEAGKKIWCGHYAHIFNMFAKCAGIKSRYVEMRSDPENITGSVHEFNEYFSPEQKQWVAVDIMYDNVRYTNANGKMLNGVEVKNTDHNDSSVTAFHTIIDTVTTSPFSKMEPSFFDVYGKDKELWFYKTSAKAYNGTALSRFKNFTLPHYWYEFYSDKRIADNRKFYLKQLLLVLLLISGIFTAAGLIAGFFKRKK